MNKIIKNTLILTVITVVSGLLLGVVYGITKEPIAAAQENTKQEAYRAVLTDASEFVEYDGLTPIPLPAFLRTAAILPMRLPRLWKDWTTAARSSDM